MTAQQQRVIQALKDGPLTRLQINAKTGIKETSLCGRLDELQTLGLVEELGKILGPFGVGNVRYRLTEAT